MEDKKDGSSPSDHENSGSLPLFGPNSPPKSPCYLHNQTFAETFTTLYHSIFPPKSPLSLSPSDSSTSKSSATAATEHRLNNARLILEYQQLCDHHDLCISRLHRLSAEINSLRSENANLRRANSELVKLLSLSSQANMQTCFFSDMNWLGVGVDSLHQTKEDIYDISPTSVMDDNRFDSRNPAENVSLPKSISVRSRGYLRNKTHTAANSSSSRAATRSREKPEREEDVDVVMQGMLKTELCNKWEETGTCPYGDRCRFAHGIRELRPVIRHPRYKTELCRMILGGGSCPYGHRCHFRHALTQQERFLPLR